MADGLTALINRNHQHGTVVWIGLRPQRRAPMKLVARADIRDDGLQGDHGAPGKRAVTLLQAEHLPVIAALMNEERIDPAQLRRNIVVSGINLLALKRRTITLGSATLEVTGPCAPCSRMEEELGHGGYSAVRGHGGMTARVIKPGMVKLNDRVEPVSSASLGSA